MDEVKFGHLADEPEALENLIAMWSPSSRGVKGAMGATTILARIVVESVGALGIDVNPDEPVEEEIERIRRRLDSDTRDLQASIKKSRE